MQISRRYLDAYNSRLLSLEADAEQHLNAFISSLDWSGDYFALKGNRNLVIDEMQALVSLYGDVAAELGSELFETIMIAEGRDLEAEIADPISDKSIAASVRSSARHIWGETCDVEAFKGSCAKQLRRYVAMAANKSVAKSCAKYGMDDVRFARVPMGKTCEFCIMLASRGFVYANEKTAGKLGQYHYKCDCRIVPGIEGSTSIEGYDPDVYYRAYKDSRDTLDAHKAFADWNSFDDQAKKEKPFAHYWRGLILEEMRTHDLEWLNSGLVREVSYETEAVEKNTKPHEVETAKRIAKHGMVPHFVQDFKWVTDEKGKHKVGLPDLINGIELKAPLESRNPVTAMRNYLENVRDKKEGVTRIIVDNTDSNFSDEDLLKAAADVLPEYPSTPALTILKKDGKLKNIN